MPEMLFSLAAVKKHNDSLTNNKSRKRREELSVSAAKCLKKEKADITFKFN
jgi:hypothetical protein